MAWTGLVVAQDDESGSGSVSSAFSYFIYIYELLNWFQICSGLESDHSSPSYVSGHSSSNLSTGRPIVGQYLNSDTAPNNHDSTGFQAYQQNVSNNNLTHTSTLKSPAVCMQDVFMHLFDFLH